MKNILLLISIVLFFSCNNQPATKMSASLVSSFSGGAITADNTVIDGATITTPVTLSGVNNITFNHCTWKAGILIQGYVKTLRIYNSVATGIGILVDAGHFSPVFTGSNYVLQNLSIDSLTQDGEEVLQGDYDAPYLGKGYMDSISITNVKYTSSNPYAIPVYAAGIFRYNFSNWKITLPLNPSAPPAGSPQDIARFYINGGNGEIKNISNSGGWGWLCRVFALAAKNQPNDVSVYNCIDRDKPNYGGIELRSEAGAYTTYTIPANIHAVNNTGGNYKDKSGGYSNNIVLIPGFVAPYTLDIRNNVSFNVQTLYKNQGGNVGSFGTIPASMMSNNVYYATE